MARYVSAHFCIQSMATRFRAKNKATEVNLLDIQ